MDKTGVFISFPSMDSWRHSQIVDHILMVQWNIWAFPICIVDEISLRKLDFSQEQWFPQMLSTIHERVKLLVATSNSHETGHVEPALIHDDVHAILKHCIGCHGMGLGLGLGVRSSF
jgi:hypothetical protein